MTHLNVEIKAICPDAEKIRRILAAKNADFHGTDEQVDTYFHCPNGRLKLREGKIENNLIHYFRENSSNPKTSQVTLFSTKKGSVLKKILADAYGIKVVVKKKREIYFIDNVKFHIDRVAGLGAFVEIEAIDSEGRFSETELREQCERYLRWFGIQKSDLLANSYSDMLLGKGEK
ncbi:MAG: class IV adenylate cyclase [Calditrichaeota bacterium]|nr:class IV adenylate cyclase [Calditrichota bacterium]